MRFIHKYNSIHQTKTILNTTVYFSRSNKIKIKNELETSFEHD